MKDDRGVTATAQHFIRAIEHLRPLILEHAAEAEQRFRLSQPVVDALAAAGLYRLYIPKSLGGSEMDPLDFYKVIEVLASIDGSTAWCVWIACTNPLFVSGLNDRAAKEVYGANPNVITAGVFYPYGKAIACNGGHRISGRWPFVSGCLHADWTFGLCRVFDEQERAILHGEEAEVRAFYFPTSRAQIINTWDVSGLCGTGSNDVSVDQLYVASEYSSLFRPRSSPVPGGYFSGSLYSYPFWIAGGLPISAVALGIAQGALDTCHELAQSKKAVVTGTTLRDRPLFQFRIAEATALVRSARAWLHLAIETSWTLHRQSGQVPISVRGDVMLAAVNATRSASSAVDIAYTIAGAAANYRHCRLQRALRDIHAATQHLATAPHQFESAGRMLLGLEPLQPARILD